MKLFLALAQILEQSYNITTIVCILKFSFRHTTNFILTYIHDIEEETPQ
jgi:hypothetical protein